jgi:hypothetical protein
MKPHYCVRNGRLMRVASPMDTKTAVLITALGGPTAVARRFKIRSPSVIGWRTRGGIPAARLQTLQAMAVTQQDIAAALVAAGFPVCDSEREAA